MTATKRPLVKQPDEQSAVLTLDDPRLDAFRPDPKVVEQYVSRTMKNGQTDIEYLIKVWERRENVLLVGDTQGGKTMLVQVMAVVIGMQMGLNKPLPVFTLSASNGITDFDLFGQPTVWVDESGAERVVRLPGLADMAARIGGIFYLDEVNMMPERVTSSLHPMCDWRRAFTNRSKAVQVPGDGFMPEVVPCSDNLWIVATMNPNYRGAGALNEAFANRFRHLEWEYDAKVERRLVPNEGCRLLGQALRNARAQGHIRTPVGTSALMRLAQDVAEDGADMALYSLLSMFTPTEKEHVNEVIESQSFRSMIVSMPTGVGEGWPDGDDESPF